MKVLPVATSMSETFWLQFFDWADESLKKDFRFWFGKYKGKKKRSRINLASYQICQPKNS